MKRRNTKHKAEIGVSRWLLQVRKEEAPLVVPKVIRQYTRRKKETPAEPENKVVATATSSEQSECLINHYNEVKIKEEYDVEIDNDIKISGVEVKAENSLQNCYVKLEDIVDIKENLNKVKNSSANVSEKECQPRMKISVKMEPLDDMHNTNLDQKNVAACSRHYEGEGKAVNLKSDIDRKLESYDILHKMNMEIENNGPRWDSNTALLVDKSLLTEEINIKDESIETDTDIDCEIAEVTEDLAPVSSKIKDEPVSNNAPETKETTDLTIVPQSQPEQVRLRKINVLPSHVPQPRPDVLRTYRGKKMSAYNMALKKCYLVAVNVEYGASGVRQAGHNPVVLAANSPKVVDPESLAGFKVVAKSEIFTCDICSKHFLSRVGVRNHVRSAHTLGAPHICHCGARFPYHFLLLAHMRSHSGPLACDLCPKRFTSIHKYGCHLNTHLRERLYPCPVCMRRYTILAALNQHASRHTASDVFKCSSCSSSFRCITDLRRHSERDHGEKVDFPCYVCSRILSSNDEFIAHVKTHDNALTALHDCAFCSKRFADYSKWEEHSKLHIEIIGYTSAAMRPYVCGVCRKRFEYRSVLKSHMTCHTGERPYKCKECPKTFKTRSAVSEHEKGHSRPYPCTECPARFAKRDSLSRHLLLHSGERPYACAGCPLTFTQRSAMKQHFQRFHTPGLKRAPKKKGRKKNKPTPAVAD